MQLQNRGMLIALFLSLGLALGFPIQTADAAEDPVSYDDHKVVSLNIETPRDLRTVLAVGAKAMSCRVGLGEGQYVVSPEQFDALEQAGLDPIVHIRNFQAMIDLERALNDQARIALGEENWFSVFREWPEVNAYMDELAALRPDLAEKIEVGESYEGRTIYGMRITGPGENKPAVLFNGTQHAREWVAVMVPMYIADRLVRDYDDDPYIQELVDRVEFFIVPIVNPDGYEYTYADDGDRMWRKNRSTSPGSECIGTDLNRNWDADWGGPHSTSTNPCNFQIYVGSEPMSEPETQAMAQLIQSNPQITAHVDYHSYSELILQPLGFTNDPLPDESNIDALGSEMRQAILDVHGKDYPNGKPGQLLYSVSGSMPDWLYLEQDAFAYTIELRPSSFWDGGFLLPPEEIIPTGEENFPAAMTMAEWAANGVAFSYPQGVPEEITAGKVKTFALGIASVMSGPIDTGSATLHVRTDPNEPFEAFPINHLAGTSYIASIPAFDCGETVEFYVEVATDNGPVYRSPASGEYEAQVVVYDNGKVVDCPEGGCEGDVTGSGEVNVDDLLEVLNNWGDCLGCDADINDDGTVNVDDLLILLNNWGPCD